MNHDGEAERKEIEIEVWTGVEFKFLYQVWVLPTYSKYIAMDEKC